MRYFFTSPVLEVMITSLLPLLSLPNETIPSISVTTAGLDGFLASNISVTLGSPPVISPDEPADLGIFARIVPASILSLSLTDIWAPTGTLNTLSSFLNKIVIEGESFLFLLSIITFSL